MSISKDSSTGLSKGFGFVKYMNKESADKAKATLNGTPLKDFPELKASARCRPQPHRLAASSLIQCMQTRLGLSTTALASAPQVRVLPSQAKNRLYVGNIPKSLTHDQLVDTLKPLTKGAPRLQYDYLAVRVPMPPCFLAVGGARCLSNHLDVCWTSSACARLHATVCQKTFLMCPGFQSLELVKSKEMPGQNRGFCFVEFHNSACAAHAKNALSPPGYMCAPGTHADSALYPEA